MIRILLLALLLTACNSDKTYPVACLNVKTLVFVQGEYHTNNNTPYIEGMDGNGMNVRIDERNSDQWYCARVEKNDAAPVSQA